tara:strand:+ start:303 stop:509 length:207 start_codon:yes stop_codon:yes gene_type:complete
MNNDTKLIMEAWRRFINEDNGESSLNAKSRETMTDPEEMPPEGNPPKDEDLEGENPQPSEDIDDLSEK